MKVSSGVSAQDVNQGAKHKLFVEGDAKSLDVTVLGSLLHPMIRVEPLGTSVYVRAAAKALHGVHPEYWFIIDRDDWSDEEVEKSWQSFPDPTRENLLIWRRKELESYFLEPDWLAQPKYLKRGSTPTDLTDLESWLTTQAGKRVWIAAANRVLIRLRGRLRDQSADLLPPGELMGRSAPEVEQALIACPWLKAIPEEIRKKFDERGVRDAYRRECELLTGGGTSIAWGQGRWRDLMPAKTLFHDLINRWMSVPDRAKGGAATLSGPAACRVVADELLRNHPERAPEDLRKLRDILARLTGAP